MKNEDIIRMVNEIFYASDKNTVHLPEENIDIPILEEPLITLRLQTIRSLTFTRAILRSSAKHF